MGSIGAFFGGVGKWLMQNPAVIVIIGMAVAFALTVASKNATIGVLSKTNKEKTEQITYLTESNTTLRNNNTNLVESAAKQNAALKELNTKSDTLYSDFKSAMATLTAANAKVDGKITAIRNAPAPEDKCTGAFELLKGATK